MLGDQPRATEAGSVGHWLRNSEYTTSLLKLGKVEDPHRIPARMEGGMCIKSLVWGLPWWSGG